MRAIRTGKSFTSRSRTSVSTALVGLLTLCLSGTVAKAQAPASAYQNVVMSQSLELGVLPGSDGTQSGQAPAGTNIAVNSNGDVLLGDTYGGNVLIFSGKSAGVSPSPKGTILGSPGGNPSGVAVDSRNNLYIGLTTVATIIKLPYVNGAYAALAATSGSTPHCTGNDTVECIMNNLNTKGSGVGALVFDSKGDLFYTTTSIGDNGAGTAPNSIWECTAACLYSGTPAATLLFTEPTSATPATTGQLNLGGLAVDSFGDVFFTDSAQSPTTSNLSYSSNLNELVYTSGTGFAATPVVLYTYTPPTASQYDNQIDGVAVDASNTVYALNTGAPGLVAFPNTDGVINTSKLYVASTTAGKVLGTDGLGNFYLSQYSNDVSGDIVLWVGVNVLKATSSAISTPSTATFTTLLNDGGCSPAPMVTYVASGTSASEFSAATTGTCSATATGGSYSTALTFTPNTVGITSATLMATDTNAGSGTATAHGNGTGTVATPAFSLASGTYSGTQSVTITDATVGASVYFTIDGSTPSATSTLYSGPISVASSETINAIAVDAGDTSSPVATATYIINALPATATPTFSVAAGTYGSGQSVTIHDSASGAAIYYTTDGSTPTAASTRYTGPIAVTSSENLQAIAIASGFSSSAVASAAYTINLSASAFQNVVISQAIAMGGLPSGGGAQSGGEPAGDTMAVNAYGNLIASNTYGSAISLFAPGSTAPTPLGTITNPNGVAVDSQNNLYIGLSYNSQVVKIPYVNGTYAAIADTSGSTPNCTGNDTVECVMSHVTLSGGSGVVSIVFDSKGDMFFGTTNQNQGGNNISSIYECTAACLYTGTPAVKKLFQEPTAPAPNTTGQLSIGGMSIDAAGNLFFTDSAIGTANNQESFVSNVNELVYTSGTGYAAAPTVIYTFTPGTPGNFDAEIDGVTVTPNGTLYALLQNTTGILAFPRSSTGTYSNTTMYLVSTKSGKLLTSDALGNLFEADNSNNIYQIALNNLTAISTPSGTPSTATNITTLLNDGGCSPAPTVTFAFTGAAASQFSAATTGTCSSTATGGALATSLTFSPTAVGASTATVTATDSLNNSAAATVLGNGTGTVATPTFSVVAGTYTATQTVSLLDATAGATIYYTLDGTTPTSSSTLYTGPIAVASSETINAIAVDAGDSSSTVASASYLINLPGGAATPTFSPAGGTYGISQAVTISDTTSGAVIYYTTDGSNPTATSHLYAGPIAVSSTQTLKAIAFASGFSSSAIASALYTITLPASTFQNVVMSQATAMGALPSSGGAQSGGEPAGDTMAVNAYGNLIASNTYGI